jgi:glycerol-3-phosphate dehydrogenase subunit C
MGAEDEDCASKCGSCARPAVDWRSPDFFDEEEIAAEFRRVSEICSDCRICESLCEVFPRLFELLDHSPAGESGALPIQSFERAVDACTLCDMCFPVCPYKAPHSYAVDFPNLMVRYRALEHRQGKVGFFERELAKTDRNGRLASFIAPVANWATNRNNRLTRALMESLAGVHRNALLPCYETKTLGNRIGSERALRPDDGARKVVIYNNCLVEYNVPSIGLAARSVLSRNGVTAEFAYPGCCGMPLMEKGDIQGTCAQAEVVSRELLEWIDEGYDVVSLVPSCTFMLKTMWPIYMPQDKGVARLSESTYDICEYLVALARADGLVEGRKAIDGGVALHVPCHSRAQAMGPKSAVMLRMIPNIDVLVIERCSGHGGTWGVMKDNFDIGMKIGQGVVEQIANSGMRYLASECPLAADQIMQGMETLPERPKTFVRSFHPIELLEMSYNGKSA